MRSLFELHATDLSHCGLAAQEAEVFIDKIGELDKRTSPENAWPWITKNLLKPEHPLAVHALLHAATFRNWDTKAGPVPAWFPVDPMSNSDESNSNRSSNISWLMHKVAAPNYPDLHAWSVSQPQDFWAIMVERLGVKFHTPPQTILDLADGPEHAKWLVGARLNIVASCFQAPDNSPAIVSGSEDGKISSLSVAQLRSLVGRVANGLLQLGATTGDRIALDMPMTSEAVAIYLGALAIGCPVVTIADSFAAAEIVVRLDIGKPRLIFTQDVARRGGKEIRLYEKVTAAGAPRAIVVPCGSDVGCPLRDGDLAWHEFLSDRTEIPFVPRDAADCTTILFSSGTTGAPKAIPWNQTTPIKAAIDAHLHQDVQPGDVLCWPTNMGWMMGPWLVHAALTNKATMALYDGAPTTAQFGRFVQDALVTMLGVVPSLVSTWRKSDCLAGLDWSRIRVFSSTGECSNPDDMLFLMSRALYKPIIEYCGGTEIGGGYLAGTVVQPAAPSTFSTPTLGTDLVLLDEAGQPADIGEVFIVPPAMGLSQTLLNGDHHAVYYADTPAGGQGRLLRRHGDRLQRYANGYFRAHGRSDDAMNLGGIKVSSLQIEDVIRSVSGVHEVAAVAVPPPGGGPDRLVVYAVLTDELPVSTDDLRTAMQRAIRSELNPLFKVHDVVVAETLPRTASNKVMRRSLRADYQQRMPQ